MSGKWQGGKGSDPRPTNRKKFEENWERIFGRKEDKPKRKPIVLWVLCPGRVKSKNDGQTHYITEKQLRQLYNLKYLDYVLTEEEYATRRGIRPEEVYVIRLHPRYEGDYFEHKKELIGEWEKTNGLE